MSRLNRFQIKTDEHSKLLCNESSETYRKELISIVSDSEVLSEDKKEEIMNMIMTYEDLQFVLDIDRLDIDYFKKRIKIKDVVLFDSDNLSIGRLVRKYNQEFNENAVELKMAISTSHQNSYKMWQNALLSKVRENIVDYSPKLLSMQKQIEEETLKINELEDRQRKIENSIDYIHKLIDWHEIEE